MDCYCLLPILTIEGTSKRRPRHHQRAWHINIKPIISTTRAPGLRIKQRICKSLQKGREGGGENIGNRPHLYANLVLRLLPLTWNNLSKWASSKHSTFRTCSRNSFENRCRFRTTTCQPQAIAQYIHTYIHTYIDVHIHKHTHTYTKRRECQQM